MVYSPSPPTGGASVRVIILPGIGAKRMRAVSRRSGGRPRNSRLCSLSSASYAALRLKAPPGVGGVVTEDHPFDRLGLNPAEGSDFPFSYQLLTARGPRLTAAANSFFDHALIPAMTTPRTDYREAGCTVSEQLNPVCNPVLP